MYSTYPVHVDESHNVWFVPNHVHVLGANDESQCASREELATMKADMQRQIDELHTQLHYWQNITVAILREQHHIHTGGTCTCRFWDSLCGTLNSTPLILYRSSY